MRKMVKKRNKGGKKFRSEDVIHYLQKENVFLSGELKKLTGLCASLSKTNKCHQATISEPLSEQTTPIPNNIKTPAQSGPETTFVITRRTAPLRITNRSWEPDITLNNSFSALSVNIDGEDNGSVTDSNAGIPQNVTIRKSAVWSKQQTQKRPDVTTTERYLQNYVPIVPGKKTYAKAVNEGRFW